MTESTATNFDPNGVRKALHVEAPPAVAWRVFTEKMGTWWPLAHYKIGKTKAVDAVIPVGRDETRVELEHRRLDRYGARRDEMRRIFDTEGDWGKLLGMFAAAATAGAPG